MRFRHLVPLLLAGFLLPVIIPGGVPEAGAQTEVDRAEEAVDRAAAERTAAEAMVEAWATRRGTIQDRVMATLFSLEQTNDELEGVAFEVFDLREAIFDAEARVRSLREITEARAVQAYMNGATPGALSIWAASTFEQTALLEETAASAQRADSIELASLATERAELAVLQEGYQQTHQRLSSLREDIMREGHALQDLFAQIDAEYVTAYEGLQRADGAFQRALSEAEAAERRRAALAGVEPWRPLVEHYFPGDRVEEALRVMRCESSGNPDAVHPESDASGLFQFLAGTWTFASIRAGFPGASRFDAEANVAAASWLVEYSIRTAHPRGAWGHWVCQP
jgi:hypothetical protein